MVEDIPIEDFIEEIKNNPILWDNTKEEYKDSFKKRSVWLKVCERLCENFAELSENKKQDMVHKLGSKWRNVRDNFWRYHKKKAKGHSNVKEYKHAKQMEFLTVVSPRIKRRRSSSDNESSNEDIITENTEQEIPYTPNMSYGQTIDPYMLMDKSHDQRLVDLDEDRAFFESLIPTVKMFTVDQKLEYRTEIMKLTRRIRTEEF